MADKPVTREEKYLAYLTGDLKNKIDVFFAVGRITEEQYNELMDVNKEEEPKAENN